MSAFSGFQSDTLATPGSHFDLIQEGPFATVSRTWTTIMDGGQPQWVVVKSSTTLRKFAREPHDIVKELRLLSSMTNVNIVCIMGSFRDDEQHMLSIYMPHLPISLCSILASPYFSPHPFPPSPNPTSSPTPTPAPSSSSSSSSSSSPATRQLHSDQFTVLAKSLMLQTLSALAFLHDELRRIGHRDVKPENIMLAHDGCVKLIDFGVAWKERETDEEKERNGDLWVEGRGRMYFEVSTGAYRAPELLFSTRTYDQCAIDLWSLGAIFAGFFTPLRLSSSEDDDNDGDDEEDDDDADDGDDNDNNNNNNNNNQVESDSNPDSSSRPEPFIVPRYLRIGYPGAQWKRDTLFNGERGEIGLAWSIFKILGTPDKENWPDFEDLPGATSVVFNVVPPVSLLPLLPNLPPSFVIPSTSAPAYSTPSSSSTSKPKPTPPPASASASAPKPKPTPTQTSPLIDLISRLLTYPPAQRIRAEEAMRHPWFTGASSSSSSSSFSSTTTTSLSSGSGPGPGSGSVSATSEAAPSPSPSPIPILLPRGYALERNHAWLKDVVVHEWRGRTLGEVIGGVLVGQGGGGGDSDRSGGAGGDRGAGAGGRG